jgi:GNAT superfamily N-acetyltransferase
VALFEAVFGRRIDEAHWQWKFGRARPDLDLTWIAEAGGRIVGHYGAWPTPMTVGGHERLALAAADAMVAADHRRRGVLTALVEAAHEAWRTAGVSMVIGLPNEQWGSRMAALGWQRVGRLEWLARPLDLEAVAARLAGLRAPRAWKPITALWNRWFDRGTAPTSAFARTRDVAAVTTSLPSDRSAPLAFLHDADWMRWRYVECPSTDYHLLVPVSAPAAGAYAVCQLKSARRGMVGLIAEIAGPWSTEADARGALVACCGYLRQQGADAAVMLAIEGSRLARRLRRTGFRPVWGAFDLCVVPLDAAVDATIRRALAEWVVAGGDFDVV